MGTATRSSRKCVIQGTGRLTAPGVAAAPPVREYRATRPRSLVHCWRRSTRSCTGPSGRRSLGRPRADRGRRNSADRTAGTRPFPRRMPSSIISWVSWGSGIRDRMWQYPTRRERAGRFSHEFVPSEEPRQRPRGHASEDSDGSDQRSHLDPAPAAASPRLAGRLFRQARRSDRRARLSLQRPPGRGARRADAP